MSDPVMFDDGLAKIMARLRAFNSARGWEQFHDPKSLAMAIASEAGELLAELRWVHSEDSDAHVREPALRQDIENEVADVAIALLLFCDRAEIDLMKAIDLKIDVNASNYPIQLSIGRAERPEPTGGLSTPAPRIVAVDWSGDAGGGAKTIWLAEVVNGEVVRLENGRNRSELAQELIRVASNDPNTIVGLDFAFSFPQWFVTKLGASTHVELWDAVALHGEAWLRLCEPPFWGRPGARNPRSGEEYRETERVLGRQSGGQAKSVFQIGGAGAVGTGSLRGMPILAQLRRAGYSIWPFDDSRLPMAVEIYPRILTGAVVKSSEQARSAYLEAHYSSLSSQLIELGAKTEDAFDALVSAMVMWKRAGDLPHSAVPADPTSRIEGRIWAPAHRS